MDEKMDKNLSAKLKRVDIRKRSGPPPVKLACLACRNSRTRCDGKEICTSCLRKGRECKYIPSKRGGARTACRSAQKDASKKNNEDKPSQPLSIEQYIEPGAGLQNLEDVLQDSDFIFDSVFRHGDDAMMNERPSPDALSPVVRMYRSDRDILDAYYVYIHPYFPILPPPESPPIDRPLAVSENEVNSNDADYEPSSPLSLAILAILSLIPHPDDPDPINADAVVFRRKYAECLAQSALESVEIESEVPESSTSPAQVLSEDSDSYLRIPFHPYVPVELESIIALSILSVYEYAQRGNIKRMRQRAGQALVAAIDISLHNEPEAVANDHLTEARRRAWWMTYVCVCQGSIVSVTVSVWIPNRIDSLLRLIKEPSISMNDPRFTTRYPTIRSDPDAWPFFIEAQRAILEATNAVIALNKALKAKTDVASRLEYNQELDKAIELLAVKADTYSRRQPINAVVDSDESVVADSLRAMARIKVNSARIKLHRYSAFFDQPLFSQKHCDLKPSSRPGEGRDTSPMCFCSTSNGVPSISSMGSSPEDQLASRRLSNTSMFPPEGGSLDSPTLGSLLAFGNHESAKICLKSALNIAESFESLPYPNRSGSLGLSSDPHQQSGIWTWKMTTPRTMPSFACCAMQSSYALLMIRQRAEMMCSGSASNSNNPMVNKLFDQLQQGLRSVVGALENYSIAFEALAGMRDQIKAMVDPSSHQ